MFQEVKELYSLLTHQQRRALLRLQVLVVLMAFAEVAGVFSIGPFMSLVVDTSILEEGERLGKLYSLSGLAQPESFLFWMGVVVFFVLAVASCFSVFTTWRLTRYGQELGAELSTRLYKHYMQQPWAFHASTSSASLLVKINSECTRLTGKVIIQLLQLNAKMTLSVVMLIAILVYDPIVALLGGLVFSLAYGVLYRMARNRLVKSGRAVTQSTQQRTKLMQEGFGGIKDTLLLGRQAEFNQRFESASQILARAQSTSDILGKVPRYIMELVAYGSVILLILFLLALHEGDLSKILPVLAIYALAGFKLLPAFQQIYLSITQVRSNLASFSSLKDDLINSQNQDDALPISGIERLSLKQRIELNDINFRYPSKQNLALSNFSIEIPSRQVVGLVGASGSGKSTAVDVLLGLLEPETGQLCVDGQPVSRTNLRAWQNTVGYVPQSIFLADASIRENIAFGLPREVIDEHRIQQAVKMAHLEELVAGLPDGLNTRVGERGVQLSGGQRQRIGIARALYDDAEVLVLDEATSALDGITEKLVIDAIHDFSGKKTVIMIAHRLSTVRQCNRIYLLNKGQVVDYGTYDELIKRNRNFKRMASCS